MGGLNIPPDVPKFEESALAIDPFSGAYRTFGEASTRLGVMAEINGVCGRVEYEFVHAYDIPFAKRRDLDFRPVACL